MSENLRIDTEIDTAVEPGDAHLWRAAHAGRAGSPDSAIAPEESDSDVHLCGPPEMGVASEARAAEALVTLFVYGWENVAPGPLSWVFPSFRAALTAVRAMRNAQEWSICDGAQWTDMDTARAMGAILLEQNK